MTQSEAAMNSHPVGYQSAHFAKRSEYSSASSFFVCAKQVLDSYGFDGEKLLADSGISISADIHSRAMLPPETIGRSWHIVANTVDDPAIGVRAAATHFNPVYWQSLGLATLCSTSVRDAFERIVRYFSLLSDAAVVQLREDPKTLAFVGYPLQDPEDIGFEAMEFCLMALLTLLREILPTLTPVEIRLLRPTKRAHLDFTELFGCPVSFGSDCVLMSFDLLIVDRILPTSNQALAEYQDCYSDEFLRMNCNANVLLQVKNSISRLLPGGEPTLTKVAETLGMSERSLQRKLQSEQTNFRRLFLDTRKQMAFQYIEKEQYSLLDISSLLAFSDHSNFSRAFKQWSGLTPSDYRKGYRQLKRPNC
ncbi:MAG: AraC family transcriptional regulator ligand-binding domain-containing protein [Pseudomonadales bacterium]